MAAGEFLTDTRYLDALRRVAPPRWEGRNLQVVLAASVIKGNSGPPRVVATHFWLRDVAPKLSRQHDALDVVR